VSSEEATGFRISSQLSASYYEAGYWGREDFWECFQKVAATYRSAVALVDREREVTFSQLEGMAVTFGSAARVQGQNPGDVVIIHGRHAIEAVVAILGCAYAGLVPALLPAMFSAEQIIGILEHTGSRLVVATGIDKEIDRAVEACTGRALTLVLPAECPSREGAVGWETFTAPGESQQDMRYPMDPDALLLLIFSSGTTGAPKGVMHSSNTVRFSVEAYAAYHEVDENDIELVVTAFGFVGSSLLGFYLTLLRGCRSILLRNWSAEEALEHVGRHHPTHLLLMPTHAIDILSCTTLDTTDCSSIRRGVVAGVAEPYRLDARKRLCAIPFPMYGMSESPAHITGGMSDSWEMLKTTEGRPLPGTELLICDDNGHPVEPGQPGEILVRGPNRFLGYYRAPDLNEESISEEGFFRTGDIGYTNESGYMTFLSRCKDIIRRGGVTITPSEIEEAIRSHPQVSDVAVIGLPDERLGERACACLITRDGSSMSLEGITEFLEERGTARYLWPESVQMCTEFPRTPSLKVQKNQLKQQILDQIR